MGRTACMDPPACRSNKKRRGPVQTPRCDGAGNESAAAAANPIAPAAMPLINSSMSTHLPTYLSQHLLNTDARHTVLPDFDLASLPRAGRYLPQATGSSSVLFKMECGMGGDSRLSDVDHLVPLQAGEFIYSGVGDKGEIPFSLFNGEFFDTQYSLSGGTTTLLPLQEPLSIDSVDSVASWGTTTYSPPESTVSGTSSTVPFDIMSEMSVPPSAAANAPGRGASSSPSPLSRGPSPLSCNGSLAATISTTALATAANHTIGATTTKDKDRTGTGNEYVCLARKCEATFPKVEGLQLHAWTAHRHACLWDNGDNGSCESFATREELNWHVKKEHLLICPVLGCRENAFPSREIIDCHLKCVHQDSSDSLAKVYRIDSSIGNINSSSLLRQPTRAKSPQPDASTSTGPVIRANTGKRKPVDSSEDRALKMQMSIGASKNRCRGQLRAVVEKRFKQRDGGTLKAASDSPGALSNQTTKLVESASFPIIWEHGVLPFLVEFMPKWCGPSHVISVTRGRQTGTRRICIMTERVVSRARRVVIAAHVRDLLPTGYRSATTFTFSTGEVERLVWARGLARGMPDEVCRPRNPFYYVSPCMGDSIGLTLECGDGDGADEITATLGPCLTMADGSGSFWLANFHPFVEAVQARGVGDTDPMVAVEHPSPEDRSRCLAERHDILSSDPRDFKLGTLAATSGYDLKTTRVSHEPYWEGCDKDPPLVVTDWALISANARRQANLLRKFPSSVAAPQPKEPPVTAAAPVMPGVAVCSTGRTSGPQRGQVCEIPAYVHGGSKGNGTGRGTREWFVEEPEDPNGGEGDENAWIRGGIGVQGDSGAAVVCCETNALVGQLWGRNKYFGPGPRHAFFTPILDVIDDIQEKCGEPARPRLPQYRDEADHWPAFPVCQRCFEMREYMDGSRRGSRESLMSMIGGVGGIGGGLSDRDRDHDLTSISELTTPREHARTPRETSTYLIRHTGTDESGFLPFGSALSPAPSLNNALSPAPVHTFAPALQAKSPGGVGLEMRAPYAQTLDEEDLYDTKPVNGNESLLGKRPRVGEPILDDSHRSEKRRRL